LKTLRKLPRFGNCDGFPIDFDWSIQSESPDLVTRKQFKLVGFDWQKGKSDSDGAELIVAI